MKSNPYTNIIILFSICLLVSISTCSCSYISNGEKIYIDNKMHIINSPFSDVKNVLIKNNKVLKENGISTEFEILVDKKTDKEILIKTNEMHQEDGPGGIWDGTPWTVRMDSKHEYYNLSLDYKYNIDEKNRIEFVYNGYGVIASYELIKKDFEKEINERLKEGNAYRKDIDTYEQHEYNYNKIYKKVYDINNEKEIELEKSFNNIVVKNNNVIGIINEKEKVYNKTYFHLDNEFNIIKELNEREYKKLIKDVTKSYDEVTGYIYRDEIIEATYSLAEYDSFRIVREDKYMYIVDDEDRLLSKKYECDDIILMNSSRNCANINEVIFVREESDKFIFFNVENDLFTTDVLFVYENPLNIYYVNPATVKYIIGENGCYAIIEDNNVNIYNFVSQIYITSIPFVKIGENNKRFYFNDFAVYGNFLSGKYVEESDFKFRYGGTRNSYYPYTNVDVHDPFLYRIINKNRTYVAHEEHIKVLDGKCEVIQDRNTKKIYVINNENLKIIKELPSIDVKGFESFECGDKTLYRVNHDEDCDLYDEELKLIEKNVNFVCGKELIVYKKSDIENNYECIIMNSDGEFINKFYGFTDRKNLLFIVGDDEREYAVVTLYDANGKDIHKTITYSENYKNGKELPCFYLSSCHEISDGRYYLFNDGNRSFIVDNNVNVVKEFDVLLGIPEYENTQSYNIPKGSDKMLYYFYYKKDNKLFNLLFDYKLNTILDEEREIPDDKYGRFKVKFYDDCFSFVKDMIFYVLDYDKNIIFKSDVSNFKR